MRKPRLLQNSHYRCTIWDIFEQAFKNIDDTPWKNAGVSSELDYIEQTSWILFLKYLDDLEEVKKKEYALAGKTYKEIIDTPYRWDSWAVRIEPRGVAENHRAYREAKRRSYARCIVQGSDGLVDKLGL